MRQPVVEQNPGVRRLQQRAQRGEQRPERFSQGGEQLIEWQLGGVGHAAGLEFQRQIALAIRAGIGPVREQRIQLLL